MTDNQQFVEELQGKIETIPGEIKSKLTTLFEQKDKLTSDIIKIGSDIQDMMSKMCRSSLFKTSVEIVVEDGKKNKTITFNHKGMGKMFDGLTYSEPLQIREVFNILKNKDIHQQILMDFATSGKKNAMPLWVEIMKTHENFNVLYEIGKKYVSNMTYKLNNPIKIKSLRVGNGKIILNDFRIDEIQFINEQKIIITSDSGVYREILYINEIEDIITLMQFSDELKEIIDSSLNYINNDRDVINNNIDEIHIKLATHFVIDELRDKDDDKNCHYVW